MTKEVEKWDGNSNYNVGDEVHHNGKHWRAKRPVYSQPQLSPRVDSDAWVDVTKPEPEAPASAKVSSGTDAPSKA